MNRFMYSIGAFLALFVLLSSHCAIKKVEQLIAAGGPTVIRLGMADLTVPEGCGLESTTVSFSYRSERPVSFYGGYRTTGEAFIIKPDTVLFDPPLHFSFQVGRSANLKLASRIARGFVPVAGSRVEGETLQADVHHGGEYCVIEVPGEYGIAGAGPTDSALLILPDIYVGSYVENFPRILNRIGYDHPVWIYNYDPEQPIEQNSKHLAESLKELHERLGAFKLDIVGFGIGGLIAHRYVADTADLYQADLSPAIIAVGTPFFGTSFAARSGIARGRSPYRFYLLDGMGDNVSELDPGSAFVEWLKNHRAIPGWQSKILEENKNFASIRGVERFDGLLPEEYEGDGAVSLSSTQLTAIEPDPFAADHFALYENAGILTAIGEFIGLYRGFNWPMLFTRAWNGEVPESLITETWAREANLNFRDHRNFDILLEWNKNLLNSAPRDAILITNGDNDTYPAWYLQSRGVRTDIMIANISLLNKADYRRFLVKNGLPLDMDPATIDTIRPRMDKKTGAISFASDAVIEVLLRQDKRPVVFSTTVYDPFKYGRPLKVSGLVYEIGTGDASINMPQCSVSIDIDRTKNLLHEVFTYNHLLGMPAKALSSSIQGLLKNYASVAFQLAVALGAEGRKDEALNEIAFAKRFSQSPLLLYNEAMSYFQIKMTDKADSILQYILTLEGIDTDTRLSIARIYHENGMNDKAVAILAECLRENPGDRKITGLIREYQED